MEFDPLDLSRIKIVRVNVVKLDSPCCIGFRLAQTNVRLKPSCGLPCHAGDDSLSRLPHERGVQHEEPRLADDDIQM